MGSRREDGMEWNEMERTLSRDEEVSSRMSWKISDCIALGYSILILIVFNTKET